MNTARAAKMAIQANSEQEHGLFCGECGNYILRGPFTVITSDNEQRRPIWLCSQCAEVFGLILGHNYESGECPCNGDARHHGYLNANGD